MKFKQVYKGFYKGGSGERAKAPTIKKELAQDVNNLMNYEDIDKYNNFLGFLNDDYILVDLDNKTANGYDENKTESNLLVGILKEYGVNTPIIETTHGHHFIFKCPARIKQNITGQLLPIGLRADYKLGSKWGWQVLKYNGVIRNIINDTEEVAELPIWLEYNPILIKKLETLENERGVNGRNNFISSYKFLLKKCGYDDTDIYKICEIINNYLMYMPLSYTEFNEVMRAEEIKPEPSFNIYGEDSFLKITEKGTTLITYKLAEKVIKDNDLIEIENFIYSYNGKVYELINEKDIEDKIFYQYKNITSSKWKETTRKLLSLVEKKEINEKYIGLKNGLLNVDTLELEPHNKNIITNYYIDVNYNPNADITDIKKYLLEIVGEDKEVYSILTEFTGYILYPKNIMRKALIIKGENNNGKSKFIEILTTFFGFKNCATLDLKQMATRFGLTGLVGKFVNFGDDISDQYIAEDSDIKKAISGEPLVIESKGKDSKQYKLNIKFLFSANNLPRFKDPTGAVSTRFIIVPFPVSYSVQNGNIDFRIVEKMTTPANMEALLLLALQGLRRLLVNKAFTYSEKAKMLLDEFNEDNNPVLTFIKDTYGETLEEAKDHLNNRDVKDIYNDYSCWCISNGKKALDNRGLGRQFKRLYPNIRTVVIRLSYGNFSRKYIF